MEALAAYALALLLAVYVSTLAERSVLSTAVLFLVAGFLISGSALDLIEFQPIAPVVSRLAELALFAVLFTDGMRLDIPSLRREWHYSARVLLIGMPLAFGALTLLARFVAGLAWLPALLLAAVLTPTDPVFASALVGRKTTPGRLSRMLNVESGLNDGLALPAVLAFIALMSRGGTDLPSLYSHLAAGLVLGVAIALGAIMLGHLPFFSATERYQPLGAFALGVLVYAVADLIGANSFLAAFTAGATVAAADPDLKAGFHAFTESIAELLKLAALLVFGALISIHFLLTVGWRAYLFAVLALLAVRPPIVWISLAGTPFTRGEKLAAGWFGPKGFASVVYALFVLRTQVAQAVDVYHIAAITIVISMIAHSSTDVLMARWFHAAPQPPED